MRVKLGEKGYEAEKRSRNERKIEKMRKKEGLCLFVCMLYGCLYVCFMVVCMYFVWLFVCMFYGCLYVCCMVVCMYFVWLFV